jgi:hypothetical protein
MHSSLSKKYYLIKSIDEGPNAPIEPKNTTFYITHIVPWHNLNTKIMTDGCFWKSNGISKHLLGEFDSFERAFAQIPYNFSDRRDAYLVDPQSGRTIVMYEYFDPRQVWNVNDWLDSGNYILNEIRSIEAGEISIKEVAEMVLKEVESENIILDGDIEDKIEEDLEERKHFDAY